MLLGMANKALVVAEPIYRPSPYRPGVHYVSASLDEMPEAIGRYLADEESRRRITDAAYRFVTEELTMERSAEAILRLVPVRA
jgi:glycosyltransferase involved in cell wall biosynthesis